MGPRAIAWTEALRPNSRHHRQSLDAGITEVLDLKGLREGMNRQDTYLKGQKADDQLANFFYFCIMLISSTK
jgi:hypothetical protein